MVRSMNSTPSPPPTSLPSTKPEAGAGRVVAAARSSQQGIDLPAGDHEDLAVGADQIGVAGGDQPDGAQIGLQRQPLLGRWGRRWRFGRRRQHARRHEVGGVDGHRPGGQLVDEAGRDGGGLRPVGGRLADEPPRRRQQPAQRRVDGGVRQRGGGDRGAHGRLAERGATRQRRRVRERSGRSETGDRAQVQPGRCLDRQLGAGEQRVGRQHRADLLPAGRHQVLLLAADHLGAETGGHPGPRVEVQLPEPSGRGAHAEAVDRPRAVERRADRAVVGVAAGRVGDGVEQLAERRRQRGRDVLEASVALLHGTQRAVHLDDPLRVAVGEVHRAAGGADVQLDRADRRCPVAAVADLERLEAPGQALEVAGGAGRELPVEVERQGDLILAGPRRAERLIGERRQPQAAPHAGIERRHEAGEPAPTRPQSSRTQQARHVTIGVALQRPGRLQARALGDQQLRVGPRPRPGQVAELAAGAAVDPQLGQRRSGRHVDRHPGAGLHDDERQPRSQPALRVGRRRREQPRQIWLVEVDGDEVVRLDVGGVASRREADDRPRVEPDDVARAGQRRRRRGATETVAERHVQLDRRPLGQLAARRQPCCRAARPRGRAG